LTWIMGKPHPGSAEGLTWPNRVPRCDMNTEEKTTASAIRLHVSHPGRCVRAWRLVRHADRDFVFYIRKV
jgi:hypothetical protein